MFKDGQSSTRFQWLSIFGFSRDWLRPRSRGPVSTFHSSARRAKRFRAKRPASRHAPTPVGKARQSGRNAERISSETIRAALPNFRRTRAVLRAKRRRPDAHSGDAGTAPGHARRCKTNQSISPYSGYFLVDCVSACEAPAELAATKAAILFFDAALLLFLPALLAEAFLTVFSSAFVFFTASTAAFFSAFLSALPP